MSGRVVSIARLILAASVVSTAIHYTDNYLFIHEYPQPEWIGHETIYAAWIAFTVFGVLGYLSLMGGHLVAAGLYLLVYSYTGLSSLGHYLYGPASAFTAKMHLLIWADGLTGLAVWLLGAWCLYASRRFGALVPVAAEG